MSAIADTSPSRAEIDPWDTPTVTPVEGGRTLPSCTAGLPYEAARGQRDEVVGRMGSGERGVGESIARWERAEMLARRGQQWLDGARERLDDAVAARRSADSDAQ